MVEHSMWGLHSSWWLLVAVLAGLIAWVLARSLHNGDRDSPEEHVRRQFAKGEISKEEFKERTTRFGHKRD